MTAGPSDTLVDEKLRLLREGAFQSPRSARRDRRRNQNQSSPSSTTTHTRPSSPNGEILGAQPETREKAETLLAALKGDGFSTTSGTSAGAESPTPSHAGASRTRFREGRKAFHSTLGKLPADSLELDHVNDAESTNSRSQDGVPKVELQERDLEDDEIDNEGGIRLVTHDGGVAL